MTRRTLLAAFLLALGAPRALAYQRDEHFYTTRLTLGPGQAGDTAALCSQLADEAPELNAIAVYERLMEHPVDYAKWSVFGRGPDATVGRVITIQQLLHGLTGGDPLAVRAIAATTAQKLYDRAEKERDPRQRADAECALGFALHLYGDSYAHQRIKNDRRMYPTGVGHFYDAARPDIPLFSSARYGLWKLYLSSALGLLPEAKAEWHQSLFDAAGESQKHARRANQYALQELAKEESDALAGRGVRTKPLARNLAERPCQEVVDLNAKWLKTPPSCEGAWAVYREVTGAAFEAWDADPARAKHPARELKRPFYAGSPFDRGVKW